MEQRHHVILYKNHGSSIGYWQGWTQGQGVVGIRYAKTLNGASTKREYQAVGKNIGRSNETSPSEQAALELESRVKKQIDKGYVRSIKEAEAPCTNNLGLLKPMLATPFDKVKPEKIEWVSAYVQPKLDGHRALFVDGILYSRQGIELDIPHIVEAIEASGLGHLHLDGELYIHGYPLQKLSGLIKKKQEGTELLEYHVYDVVADASFSKRKALLSNAMREGNQHVRIQAVETLPVQDIEDLTERHLVYRKGDYEGTMLRFGDEPYRDGKRSRTLLKLKEFHDAEFEIIGVEEGTPYGSFRVPIWVLDAGNGETFTATAQGNMHEKNELWETRADHIGKQLTVKYHYLSKLGIPQLPISLRFYETV
jgi:DNA ligase-1